MSIGLALGIGYLSAAWSADGRTWHDKAAGTAAVRSPAAFGVLVPALALALIVCAGIAAVSVPDLPNRDEVVAASGNPAEENAAFRRGYVSACHTGSDRQATGITDPGEIDGICGCVADVILGHYTLAQVNATRSG